MNLNEKIREILCQWDPIGIEDEPTAHDEYDNYAAELKVNSRQFENHNQLIVYLRNLESHMGVPLTSEEDLEEIARRIFAVLCDPKFE